jgi:hypothetical protein
VLPEYRNELKITSDGAKVWDRWRKKYVAFTPEEWVRQRLALFLTHERGFPAALLSLERGFTLNGAAKRFDLLAFDRRGRPLLLAECKTPLEKLDLPAVRQCTAYNLELSAKYMVVTNGTDGGWFPADGPDSFVLKNLASLPHYHELD